MTWLDLPPIETMTKRTCFVCYVHRRKNMITLTYRFILKWTKPIMLFEWFLLWSSFFYIMLVPVRCFTCGKLIANIYNEYLTQLKQGEEPNKIMDSLNITRYCCRRMFVSSVETIYQVIPYYEALRKRRAEIQSEMEW